MEEMIQDEVEMFKNLISEVKSNVSGNVYSTNYVYLLFRADQNHLISSTS